MRRHGIRGAPGSNQYMHRPGATPTNRYLRRQMTVALTDNEPDDPVRSGWDVAAKLSENEPLSDSDWDAVLASSWESIRRDASKRPDCPPRVLTVFAESESVSVRTEAVRHPNCPPEVLAAAVAHDDRVVASVAVGNPNCPPSAVRELIGLPPGRGDGERRLQVLRYASRNRHLPDDVHLRLVQEGFSDVYASANWTPTVVLHAVAATGHPKTGVLTKIAAHPHADAALVDLLVKNRSVTVRAAAAENPRCSPVTLTKLAESKSEIVIRAAARNPSCPSEVLESLWYGGDRERQQVIEKNPSCPEHLRAFGGFLS